MVERASAPKRSVQAGWVAVILVLALVGAGCGSETADEGQASTTATTEAAPPPPALDQSELKAALLNPADLGPDWTYMKYGSSGEDMQNAAEQAPGLWGVGLCPSGRSKAYSDPTWSVGSWMTDALDPMMIQQSLSVPRDSSQEFQLMREAFDGCLGPPWTSASDVKSMKTVTAPEVGDEAVAYVTTTASASGGEESQSVGVLVRRGPVIEFYETSWSDPVRLDRIVRTGDDKVAAALAGTSVGTATTTSTTTATTTTAPTPTGTKPTCGEVQAAIATMTTADVAVLNKAPILFFSRLPGSDDGWRITALGDVTGTAPRPDVVVYYDWTPASGLGPPVVVLNPDDLNVLQGDDTSVTLIGMTCINANVNVNP